MSELQVKKLINFLLVSFLFLSCKEIQEDRKVFIERRYPNGNIKTVLLIDKKTNDSTVSLHDENGILRRVYQYSNGKLDDTCLEYTFDKKINRLYNYTNGVLNGKSIIYCGDGINGIVTDFKNGKMDGYRLTYHCTGIINFLEKYTNDTLVYFASYDEKGKKKENYIYPSIYLKKDVLKLEDSVEIEVDFPFETRGEYKISTKINNKVSLFSEISPGIYEYKYKVRKKGLDSLLVNCVYIPAKNDTLLPFGVHSFQKFYVK